MSAFTEWELSFPTDCVKVVVCGALQRRASAIGDQANRCIGRFFKVHCRAIFDNCRALELKLHLTGLFFACDDQTLHQVLCPVVKVNQPT